MTDQDQAAAAQGNVTAANLSEGVAGGKVPEGAPQDPNVPPADAALAKAIEGGYREPEPPTREERVNMLINGYASCMEHNSPRTEAEFAEMKALLLGE